MRILYIADPGSIHDRRWINFLSAKDDIRSFVVMRRTHGRRFDATTCGLDKRVTILGSIGDNSTVRPWMNCYYALRIKRIIRRERIDLLHILYAEPNALWAVWKLFFAVPIVVTTRGSDILKTIPAFFDSTGRLQKMVAARYRMALNRADHITVTSRRQKEVLSSLGITTLTTIVRTGVDVSFLERIGGSSTFVQSTRRLVFMPRNMLPVYNHEFTLDAIEMLPDKLRSDLTFVFLNSDTSDQSYFERIRRKASTITADIRFLPSLPAEEMVRLYRKASLVVMNPISDGSPVTAMEAMACEVPVILPPLAYDEELFGSELSFGHWSANALSDKISDVLTSPSDALQSQLRENKIRIMTNGNTASQLERIYELYTSMTTARNDL